MWTRFMDMHSGGGCKEPPYEYIYIEAPEDEARVIFYNRFGHSPDRVSCTCCGNDYSLDEDESLAQLTGFNRNLRCVASKRDPKTGRYLNEDPHAGRYLEPDEKPPAGYGISPFSRSSYADPLTLDEYLARSDVLVIRAADIKPDERIGSVPAQGYVWCD